VIALTTATIATSPGDRATDLASEGNRFQRHKNSEPVSEVGQSANRLVKPLSAARRPEKTDDYPAIVTRLNERWRVIECRDAIQWILQRRKGQWTGRPQWQGQHYCRTRRGLLRCIREYCGPIDEEVLTVVSCLPERIGTVTTTDSHFGRRDELSSLRSAPAKLPAPASGRARRATSAHHRGRHDC